MWSVQPSVSALRRAVGSAHYWVQGVPEQGPQGCLKLISHVMEKGKGRL